MTYGGDRTVKKIKYTIITKRNSVFSLWARVEKKYNMSRQDARRDYGNAFNSMLAVYNII